MGEYLHYDFKKMRINNTMKITENLMDNKKGNGSIFFYFTIFIAAIIFYPLVKAIVDPYIVNSYGVFIAGLVFGFLYFLFSVIFMLMGMEANPIAELYKAFVVWILIGLFSTFLYTVDPIFQMDKKTWFIVSYTVAAISSWGILTLFNYWVDDKVGILQITILNISLIYFFYTYTISHEESFNFFSHLRVLLH